MRYGPPDPNEDADMTEQYGHELRRNHPTSNPYELGYEIAQDQGIRPQDINFDFTDRTATGRMGNAHLLKGYPSQVNATPLLEGDAFAGNLGHEINHVAEFQRGTGVSTKDPNFVQSNTNEGRHFGSDYPGQMFNYEGKTALQMMLDRLNNQNMNMQDGSLDTSSVSNQNKKGLIDQSFQNGQMGQAFSNRLDQLGK